MAEFQQYLATLEINIRNQMKEYIIGGDFNSKSTVWGFRTTDKRGEYLLEWIAQ